MRAQRALSKSAQVFSAVMLLSGTSVLAADVRQLRANLSFARQQMHEFGRFLIVCREPVAVPRNRICVNIGALSRLSPDWALPISDFLEAMAQRTAGKSSTALNENIFWKKLFEDNRSIGCVQKPERSRIVLVLAVPHGNQASSTLSCDGTSVNPISSAFGVMSPRNSSGGSFLASYMKFRGQCEGQSKSQRQRQGGATGLMDAGGANQGIPAGKPREPSIVEKAWAGIVEALGGNALGPDTGGVGGGGTRGYCFEDMGCAQSCESAARARGIAEELKSRYSYDGCNANLTPTPDGTRTCYDVLNSPKATPEQILQLRREFCSKRAGVMRPGHGNDESSHCSVMDVKEVERSRNICSDPRAMCSPDDVDPLNYPLGPGAILPSPMPEPISSPSSNP